MSLAPNNHASRLDAGIFGAHRDLQGMPGLLGPKP